ncbi:MAG: hypothetical protein ACTSQF_13680 [Candidatus Heimdallarchaeaceae archaeon]
MGSTVNRKQTLRPYLMISGILLFIFGALTIYAITCSIAYCPSIGRAPYIIRTICFYGGIGALIVPLVQIGSIYQHKKNEIKTTILLLILFIGADLFLSFYPEVVFWGSGWGGLVVFVIYGIIRLVAFIKINSSFNIPEKKYGNPMLLVYGGSFLIVSILSLILAVIGGFIPDIDVMYILMEALAWIVIGQTALDGLSFVVVGSKFLIDGNKYPTLEGGDVSRVTTASGSSIRQDDGFFPLQQPNQTTTYAPSSADEEVEALKYCSYCGAQSFRDNKYCENCGKKIE